MAAGRARAGHPDREVTAAARRRPGAARGRAWPEAPSDRGQAAGAGRRGRRLDGGRYRPTRGDPYWPAPSTSLARPRRGTAKLPPVSLQRRSFAIYGCRESWVTSFLALKIVREGLRRQRQFSTLTPNCTDPLTVQVGCYSWTIGPLHVSRRLRRSFAAA